MRDLLNQLDKDQSGKLSLSEFLVLSNQITHSDKNSCLAVIQQLYLNEDFASRVFRMRGKKAFIFDMDGVIYRGGRLIEGVTAVVSWLRETNKVFRFLTNNSRDTPSYLKEKLTKLGVSDVDETMFWTAALSTAAFLRKQKPHGCTAFVVGGPGVHEALRGVVTETEDNPDYVVVGEADDYATEDLCKATCLVNSGAILIGTNEDVSTPIEHGIEPSCGAWIKVIETATHKRAYFCGKPNPLNLRSLLEREHLHSKDCVMVGDRMATDVKGAMEANIDSILVLSGITKKEDIVNFPFRPYLVLPSVASIPPISKSTAPKDK